MITANIRIEELDRTQTPFPALALIKMDKQSEELRDGVRETDEQELRTTFTKWTF